MKPRITISDDDGRLAVFAGNIGAAEFWYGPADWLASQLRESGREETADWVDYSGAKRVAWLTGIETDLKGRGRGVGSAILRRGLAELAKRDVETVFLHAKADYGYEIRLAKWYARHGFTLRGELDELPFFYVNLERPPARRRASRRRSSRGRT